MIVEIVEDTRNNLYEVFVSEINHNYNAYNNYLGMFDITELKREIKNNNWVVE